MNKKGFTLIELLAVIALLAIIAMIAFPAVDSTLNEGRKKISAAQEKQIISGAKSFFAENTYCLPGSNNSKCVLVQNSNECGGAFTIIGTEQVEIHISCLQKLGYLPADIVNFNKDDDSSDRNYGGNTGVTVTNNYGTYEYEVVVR